MSGRRRLALAAAGVLLVWAFLAILPAPISFPHPYFAQHPRWGESIPQIIAHRGGWGLWPQHTLYGYRHAVDMGVDALELDIQRSSDGVMVVFHDHRVGRVTEAGGRIDSYTFEELQSLDAGYNWSADEGATHPFRGQGLRIPSLDEVLSTFPDQHMIIELKTNDAQSAEQLCGLLRAHRHQHRAIVASFDTESLDIFRQVCPGVATSASFAEAWSYTILHLLRLDVLANPEFEALQVTEFKGPLTVVNERFVDKSQGRGIAVQVWTIDKEQDMERLTDLGVQGLITRRPDRLKRVLEARGRR